ncbi:MAG: hypothetical protein EHM39_00015 [Chloroflexi bacterium]|nr:MAG: hypothetical protein EHM39_00015 [Chloroflexota bacterium]
MTDTEPCYRVIRHVTDAGQVYHAVHPVYLDGGGNVLGYDDEPLLGYADTPGELRRLAIAAARACREPVLGAGEIDAAPMA